MASASLSSGAASEGNAHGGGNSAAAAAAAPKNLGYVGARYRRWGRWAAELRAPRQRERLWIGTFATPKEAAHAYDAAIFCFYGDQVPKTRKINFPTAPRPDIPEDVRVGLTNDDIKTIAEEYARSLADYIPPPPPELDLPAAEAPVEAAAAAVGAPADGGAAPPATDGGGNLMDNMGTDMTTIADCLLSFNPDEVDGLDFD